MPLLTMSRQQLLKCDARMASRQQVKPVPRTVGRTAAGRPASRAAGAAPPQLRKAPAAAVAVSLPAAPPARQAPQPSERSLLPAGFTNTPSKIGTWCKLEPLWEGSLQEAAALTRETAPVGIAPLRGAAKLAVLSTGSPTQHAEILAAGRGVGTVMLQQEMLPPASLRPASDLPPPPAAAPAAGARPVQRQTLKAVPAAGGGGEQEVWMYGASWWSLDSLQAHVPNPNVPLGANFAEARLELTRDFHSVVCGTSARLEELFGCAGPFWARHYTVHAGGRPMCVIYDVFSPRMFEEADA
ncbi:MAG: hypothetical protein J3K34DRAFT_384399 [Monoraphidium minutum]|nr:MAG: hypothetical protein J3K34DRAFT_384399 [Monoraphidium minutum]